MPGGVTTHRALAAASGKSFAGAAISALSGFLLTVVLGQSFGAAGAGVVLQVIGVFTITLGVAKVGLDTTAVWLLPRSRLDEPGAIRGTVWWMLAVGAAAGALGAVALAIAAPVIFADEAMVSALRTSLWFLPTAVVATIGLGSTRGMGGVVPFVVVGQILVPGVRPVAVLVVGALGGSVVVASAVWAGALGLAVIPVLIILARQVKRLELEGQVAPVRPPRTTLVRAAKFSLPRAFSSATELAQQWLDVVLVGVIAGPHAAGLYGAATRFINAGMIPSTSMRIVVAPQFSAALHAGDTASAQRVYRSTASWIILLSAPIYVLLWLFGGVGLALLGEDFVEAAPLLGVLAIGATAFFCTGNIQSLLLMSGHSTWVAVNKVIVLAVLVLGLVIAVPRYGITGAAVVWSVVSGVDAALAAAQVSRLVGIRLEMRRVLLSLVVGAVPFVLSGVAARWWFGETLAGLAVGGTMGLVLYAAAGWMLRRPLEMDGAIRMIRRRSAGPQPGGEA